MTKEKIIKIIEEQDIKFIRLQFTDIFGAMKNVSITPSQIEKALNNKMMFDGSSIDGFARIEESDMCLHPDLDSFMVHPWDQEKGKVARLICDVYSPDGSPFEGDPRYILRKAIRHAAEMGYEFQVGPECEFYLMKTDADGRPVLDSYDEGGYFDLGPNDIGEDVRKYIVLALEDLGFEIEASHHECGPAQHEIDFKYGHALKAADYIMTFKYAVKTVSEKHKMYATFMPKPFFGKAGNGMHLNMSLTKNGKNAFVDENDKAGLSKEAYAFMAGVMKHIEGITIFTNPLINSFKRLVPDFEAPMYIAWSARNRSPLFRVPTCTGQSTRIELRSPDPSANPYLALALCLEAGLEGIEKGMVPPAPVDKNIFEMSQRELSRSGIRILPLNMYEAIRMAEKDKFIKQVLGDHIYSRYISAKTREWNEYSHRISDWEIQNYLLKY